ncbi:MAG: SPASM domain-containing protein [Chitinophagales bacterium]
MGDLQQQTFAELWHSEAYYHFRRQLIGSRKNIDICANCSEGTKVWA